MENLQLEHISTGGTSVLTHWMLPSLGALIEKKIIEEKTVMINFRNRKRTMIMAEQGTQVHSEDV